MHGSTAKRLQNKPHTASVRAAEPHPLTPTQRRTLRAFWRLSVRTGRPPTYRELAKCLHRSGPSVHLVCATLIWKGHLVRGNGGARTLTIRRPAPPLFFILSEASS